MNNVGVRILAFFFLIVGSFVAISQRVPQVSSYPQKALSPEEFSAMSAEQLTAKGKQVFGTSGNRCSQCHTISGAPGRGPNLGGIGASAISRALERSAATGKKITAQDYLLESMMKPSAYVVKGYASPSIMPEAYKSPMDLSEEDMKSLVAYMESLGGKVTMTAVTMIAADWRAEIVSAKKANMTPLRGDIANGKKIFYERMRCIACHMTTVDGKTIGGMLGPDLSRVGEIRGADSLKALISNPPGDIMPKHFKENLTVQELDDLTIFLLNLRG